MSKTARPKMAGNSEVFLGSREYKHCLGKIKRIEMQLFICPTFSFGAILLNNTNLLG